MADLIHLRRQILLNTPHLATASGDVVTFRGGVNAPLKQLTIHIEPVQSGTGDSSPYNVRPISGWTEVKAWVQPAYDTNALPTAAIQLGRTVYGGTLDVVNGTLTIDRTLWTMDGKTNGHKFAGKASTKVVNMYYFNVGGARKDQGSLHDYYLCSHCLAYPWTNEIIEDKEIGFVPYSTSAYFQPRLFWNIDSDIDTLAKANAWLVEQSEAGTPVMFTYFLATPTEISLTPTQIKAITGQNAIWADAGPVEAQFWTHI